MRGLLPAVLVLLAVLAGGAPQSAAAQAPRERSFIVVYEDSVREPAAATSRRERAQGFRAEQRFEEVVKGFAAPLSPGQVARLRRDEAVAAVVPDRPVRATALTPLVAGDVVPTGVRRIGAGTTSEVREASGVRVAVVDGTVDLDHPDLDARPGIDCVGDEGPPPAEPDSHGTHVAGIVAARNNGLGVTGVAPGTEVVSVRVLGNDGRGRTSELICGLEWITATRRDDDPSNDIAVANMSLGGLNDDFGTCPDPADPLHAAICAAAAEAVTLVAAAGNDALAFDETGEVDEDSGDPLPRYTPAAYPEVLTVTAMSDTDGEPGGEGPGGCQGDDRWAGYTNYASTAAGRAHTIAAPGCVESTANGGGTQRMSGTSMAAPHVAGLAALCYEEGGVTGVCAGRSAAQNVRLLVDRAAAKAADDRGFGFAGDPLRQAADAPAGAYFGHLAWGGADVRAPAVGLLTPVDGARGADTAPALSGTAGTAEGDEPDILVEVFSGPSVAGAPVRTPTVAVVDDRWSASLDQPLADGTYTVRAGQRDASANVGQVTHVFTVDTTGPTTRIDTLTLEGLDARATFSASEPGSGFACALDEDELASCSSPHELRDLAPGGHVLRVRATDDLGNVGPIVERSFTVSEPAPQPDSSVPQSQPQPAPTGGATAPPPTSPPPAAQLVAPAPLLHPAKLEVSRSRVLRSDRAVDVLAPITKRASGEIDVDLHAAGRHTRFTVAVDEENGRVRFREDIPRAQAAMGTGILTLRYPGNDRTRGQEVRLRAASRHADLQLDRPTLGDGRLRAEGTVAARARGVVRVQLSWSTNGRDRMYEVNTRIRDGRWELDDELPDDVITALSSRDGTVHSYTLFTGYLPARMRGEMQAYQVLGAP